MRLGPGRQQAMERAARPYECLTSGQETWLEGFTLEEDLPKLIVGALVDQARKHRRRRPTEQQAIDKARKQTG